MRRAATPVAGEPHDGDNLLDGRRVGGIELALVVRRATGVVARHRRGRAAPTGGIENYGHGHGISSQSHCGQFPPLYQPARHRQWQPRWSARFPLGKHAPAVDGQNARGSSMPVVLALDCETRASRRKRELACELRNFWFA
jgi:hypothetical protein